MCINCRKSNRMYVTMPCQVCILNNNDSTPKLVFWCDTCSAYICKAHEGAAIARTVAAVKTFVNKFIKKP